MLVFASKGDLMISALSLPKTNPKRNEKGFEGVNKMLTIIKYILILLAMDPWRKVSQAGSRAVVATALTHALAGEP